MVCQQQPCIQLPEDQRADCRWTKEDPTHTPNYIDGAEVECVANFKFLGVHLSEDLSWTLNTSILIKKARQHLYFLRILREAHLSPHILLNFYHCTIESILTNCITVWYGNCTVSDQKALQRVVKTVHHWCRATLHQRHLPQTLPNGAFPLHGTVRFGTARYGTAQFGTVCVSTAV